MKQLTLTGEKIITIEQPAIGNLEMFAVYHRIFKHGQGSILPPVIVVSGQQYHAHIAPAIISLSGHRDIPLDDLELISPKDVADQLDAAAKKNDFYSSRARDLRNRTEIYAQKTTGQVLLFDPVDIDNKLNFAQARQERFHPAKLKLSTLYATGAPYLLLDGNHRTLAAALTGQPIHALELETNHDVDIIRKKVETGALFGFPHQEETLQEIVQSFYEAAIPDEPTTVFRRSQEIQERPDFPEYFRKK